MSYGLKYISTFSSTSSDGAPNNTYVIAIYKKDYTGDHTNIIAGVSPVIHNWPDEGPTAPIKGSSVKITLVNKDNILPLSSFYSVNDDEYKVVIEGGGIDFFTGYIVQDDCRELCVDHTHYVELTATDNLGLLKNIPLDEAAKSYGETIEEYGPITGISGELHTLASWDIISGDVITIVGTGTISDGTYIVNTKQVITGTIPPDQKLILEPPLPVDFSPTLATVTRVRPTSLGGRLTLAKIIALCLSATKIQLDVIVYGSVTENNGATGRIFEDIMIEAGTFKGSEWTNCYDVLTKIFSRLNMTFFQAENRWNIVRWHELRGYENEIPGVLYNSDMEYQTTTTLSSEVEFNNGDTIYPETDLYRSIFRPLKYVKETFNYNFPEIVQNGDFTQAGNLINTYADGDNTVNEYEMAWWLNGQVWTLGGNGVVTNTDTERFIRVTNDPLGTEIDRYGVIKGSGFPSDPEVLMTPDIEVHERDRLQIRFSFKTNPGMSGSGPLAICRFTLLLLPSYPFVPRNGNSRSISIDGEWDNIPIAGTTFNIVYSFAGNNTIEWQQVSILSDPIPYDGYFRFYLGQVLPSNAPGPMETHYKGVDIEYIPYINEKTKIKGHTHKNTHPPFIKNNEDEEIFIDASPRNRISGTMFLTTFGAVHQNRATSWARGGVTEEKALGYITTLEKLFWLRKSRTKVEGVLRGLTPGGHVSMKSVMKYEPLAMSKVWGELEIDYANEKATGTMYEIYADDEIGIGDGDLLNTYQFQYLYEQSTR